MVLKHLEIQGFKSFPDKTKITFGQGLTAVVGPNGSGKSNISDAMRWVMGEQSTKNLRGSKMEDVIFTGTKTRKSQGFAEVSLFIDNSDKTLPVENDEVIITRKYYRSGESEYRVNGASVRLKDIHEMLMDTGLGKDGYAMVGQGRIAEIVQSKSDERREIFEEAAGISKYRYRKNEAEKKLVSAEENLVRLRDILGELEERLEPLRVQSEKAKKFLELAEQKKSLEISCWLDTLERSNQLLKDQNDRIVVRQLEREEIERQTDALEEEIQTIYRSMQQCLVDIDSLRKQKEETEHQISDFQAQIAVCENDLSHNLQDRERILKEQKDFKRSGEAVKEEISGKEQDIDDLTELLEQMEEQIVKFEQELLELSRKSDEFTGSAAVLNRRINELLVKESQNELSLLQITARGEEEKEQYEQNSRILLEREELLKGYEEELRTAEELSATLEERGESLKNSMQGYRMKLESRQSAYDEMKQECDRIRLEIREKNQRAGLLKDLEEHLEGFAYSVKAVLNRGKSGMLQGIFGTVSQLITVKEEYATAIETALGGSMQNIVVGNENQAKAAIGYLKAENAGRATFLPLSSVKGTKLDTQRFEETEGYLSLACDLIDCDEKYLPVIRFLLGRIAVVDNLDTAIAIARKEQYKFRIVTLDGQVINAGGSMSGGSKNKSQGFLSRKSEIQNLERQASALEQKGLEAQNKLSQRGQELANLRAGVSGIQSKMITVNEDKIRCQGEQKRLTQQIGQEKVLMEAMRTELSEYESRLSGQKEKIEGMKAEKLEIQEELSVSREKLASLQDTSTDYEENRDKLSKELSEFRYKKLETEKNREMLEQSIRELLRRQENSEEQLVKLREEEELLERQKCEIQKAKEEYSRKIQECRGKRDSFDREAEEKLKLRNRLEGSTTELRQEERKQSQQKEHLAQELARLEERKFGIQKEYDGIINKLWDEYQLTRSEAVKFQTEILDIAKAQIRLSSLKSQIKALGSVNVAAVEEYAEVSSRYEFLREQLRDVEQSRNELLRLINELTVSMREIFEENFREINRHFQQIFVDLFGGGRAELTLTDSSDILNCGIEIFVEPPGKIIKNLSLLSGGEQAFVAIAIYFAILKVHPAPFCILDEIEAALDDVNVSKYASYLRLMSDKTQFIMITHRRGTMEEADVLYGVTMQEEGVSKLLKLQVSEVEKQLGNLE